MDSTHERLLKEISHLRTRLHDTNEALYFAVEALDHLGYKDVEVKRGRVLIAANKVADDAYWNSLQHEITKPFVMPR